MTYNAVVVAKTEEGVLFAKRADSEREADHIVIGHLMKILEDRGCRIKLESKRDGFGEPVLLAKYEDTYMEYKVLFDDEKEEEVG